tara:strand:- start:107 stop:1363 length:1257 start_codon:yes stop_codon:yes gene_type:complete
MMADWHELEPPLDKKEGVYIPRLNTTVDLGSFVTWCTIGKVISVARLIDWRVNDDKKMVFVNNYVSMTTSAIANQHTMSRYLRNVSQCKQAIWLNVDCIIDIAFVFLRKEVEDLTYVIQGRTDCWVTVTRADASEYPLTFSSFPPLPNSIPRAVWDGTTRVRVLLRKMLSSTRQDQGNYATHKDKVYVDYNTWAYLYRRFGRLHADFEVTMMESSLITHEILPGLVSTTKRRFRKVETVSFRGLNGERAINELFGQAATVGVRQRRPKVADPPRTLLVNDAVNYLCVDENEVSVRFQYTHGDSSLQIYLAFRPYFVAINNDGTLKAVPLSPQLNNMLTRSDPSGNVQERNDTEDEGLLLLTVGTEFELDNQLMKVVSIGGEHEDDVVICKVTSDEVDNEQHIMSKKKDVEDLIEQYLQ